MIKNAEQRKRPVEEMGSEWVAWGKLFSCVGFFLSPCAAHCPRPISSGLRSSRATLVLLAGGGLYQGSDGLGGAGSDAKQVQAVPLASKCPFFPSRPHHGGRTPEPEQCLESKHRFSEAWGCLVGNV